MKTNKTFGLMITAMLILSISMISATPICATVETTYISGIITDQTNGNVPVSGASVNVNCNGNIQTTTSDSNGSYSVQYSASECGNGDNVVVSATHNGLSGSNNDATWYTENSTIGCLQLIVDVACANVPLVPEFGIAIGGLTILSAVGIFFFVRRK